MGRTREKAKGRRGGEGEHFAKLPESVLQSEALSTAPLACMRVLAALVCGKSPESNGTMMLSDSYAKKFGLYSKGTLRQSLLTLQDRGIIECTRKVQPLRKAATLWACTWWPIYNRDGQPVEPPEAASHRYLQWKPVAPINRAERYKRSPRSTGDFAPINGAKSYVHRPDTQSNRPAHRPDQRGNSKNLGLGAALADARLADAMVLGRASPGINAADLAKRARCDESIAHRALQKLQAEAMA